MPKVHFFKLAQELGERPVELQKKLAAEGFAVRSTSTMLDEETAEQIRNFLRQEASRASAAPVAEAPAAAPAPAAQAPTTAEPPAPQPAAPAPPSAFVAAEVKAPAP